MTDIEFINSIDTENAISKLSDAIRAERNKTNSFLDIYADKNTINRLVNNNNQIVYGRRGSGKSHLLLALGEFLMEQNTAENKRIPIYVDLRKLLPFITENDTSKIETAVLIFKEIINEILDVLIENIKYIYDINNFDNNNIIEASKQKELSELFSLLNIEFDGKKIKKLGTVEFTSEEIKKITGSLELSQSPKAQVSGLNELKDIHSSQYYKYISFSEISKYLSNLSKALNTVEIFCLIDEWSELPIKLQPFVSELLKRTFIASNFVMKIGAIPYRSKFREYNDNETKIGMEEGGDIFAVNLDNRYIFELDKNNTRDFYNELLVKHLKDIDKTLLDDINENKLINIFFANQAMSEILIASAGIPRDFIHLFILSYNNRAKKTQRIVLKNIRSATAEWYVSDKREEIEKDTELKYLFEGIVNEIVINKERTHFLLPQKYSEKRHIKKLVDLRVLHIRDKGISHKHIPNKLYDVYSVDYGSYTSLDISKNTLDTDFSQMLQNLRTIDNVRDARSLSLEDNFFDSFFLKIGEGKKCKHCDKIIDINHLAYIKQKVCNHCFEKSEE